VSSTLLTGVSRHDLLIFAFPSPASLRCINVFVLSGPRPPGSVLYCIQHVVHYSRIIPTVRFAWVRLGYSLTFLCAHRPVPSSVYMSSACRRKISTLDSRYPFGHGLRGARDHEVHGRKVCALGRRQVAVPGRGPCAGLRTDVRRLRLAPESNARMGVALWSLRAAEAI
jgi:hypothetical protein